VLKGCLDEEEHPREIIVIVWIDEWDE